MIKVKCIPVGEIEANCYFVSDDEEKISFLVDTGDYSVEVVEAVKAFGADTLQYILLTHGHFDHIGYTAQMKQIFPNAKIVISKDEAEFTSNDFLNLSYRHTDCPVKHFHADILVQDGDELPFGGNTIKVITTPGHTKGSVCYILDRMIFTGDTLFKLSIGRVDFPTSDRYAMMASIKRLAELDGDYQVYCGHGADTTLNFERKNNPFMREDIYDNLY